MKESKNKGGRPKNVLSQEQIKEVEALAQFLTVGQIADYLEIGETTFYEIQKRQIEVSEAYKKGKAKAINFVASKLMEKIRDGDTASTLFYLKTQAGWSEKQYLDVTSNASINLPAIILNTKSKDVANKDGI